MSELIERWNEQYFDGKLSAAVLGFLKALPNEETEVQSFVERVFRFMNQAKVPARDVSHSLGWALGFLPSRILPGAWGGFIPPITVPGRHEKVDAYLADNPWKSLVAGSTLLDLGCGFPPHTTVDTANRFPAWRITGADPSFGHYMVYDKHGNYACFDAERSLRYFQPVRAADFSELESVYKDPQATRARFTALLQDLVSSVDSADTELRIIEKNGHKLVCNPLRQYESSHLSFCHSGIGSAISGSFDAARCFNVLMYFDAAFRKQSLEWIKGVLNPGGLFVCGVNWFKSSVSRYSVYQKDCDRLELKEFAFSLDNIRPLQFISWFALHDDDLETNLLAEAVGVVRSDKDFLVEFDERLDALFAEANICPRGADGYVGGLDPAMDMAEVEQRFAKIEEAMDAEGFVERAVKALRCAGYEGWRNPVGHIALIPKG